MSQDYFEWLEDYKLGKLTTEQRVAFEQKLLQNTELQDAVQNYELAKKISAPIVELEPQEKVEIPKKSNSHFSTMHNRKLLWIAAIALLFCISVYFIYQKPTVKLKPEQLFAMLYIEPATKKAGGDKNDSSRLNLAIQLFDMKNYSASQSILLTLDPTTSDSLKIKKYMAHSCMKLSQLSLAAMWFQQLSSITNTVYSDEAKYHLVLIYLMQDNPSEAKKWYRKIKNKKLFAQEKWEYLEDQLD